MKLTINLGKCGKIIGAIAAFIIAAGVIYTTSLGAFDSVHSDFVTVTALEDAFMKQDRRKVQKTIRRLEYQQQNGGLTERQQWELNDAYDELDDLQ